MFATETVEHPLAIESGTSVPPLVAALTNAQSLVAKYTKVKTKLETKKALLQKLISHDKIALDRLRLLQIDKKWNSMTQSALLRRYPKLAKKRADKKVAAEISAEKVLETKIAVAAANIRHINSNERNITEKYTADWQVAASATKDYTDDQGAKMAHKQTNRVKKDYEVLASLRARASVSDKAIQLDTHELTKLRRKDAPEQRKAKMLNRLIIDQHDAGLLTGHKRQLAEVLEKLSATNKHLAKYSDIIRYSQKSSVPHRLFFKSGMPPIKSFPLSVGNFPRSQGQINDFSAAPTTEPTYAEWATSAPAAGPTLSPTPPPTEHSDAPTPNHSTPSPGPQKHAFPVVSNPGVSSFFCEFPAYTCHLMHGSGGEFATSAACTTGCKPDVVPPVCETYVIRNCGQKLQGSHGICAQCIQDTSGGPLSHSKLNTAELQAAMQAGNLIYIQAARMNGLHIPAI
jgi:hypothetical protein